MKFQYVEPSKEQKDLIQKYRDKYEELSNAIELDLGQQFTIVDGKQTPDIRCLKLTQTKLEESNMWLNKSIVGNN